MSGLRPSARSATPACVVLYRTDIGAFGSIFPPTLAKEPSFCCRRRMKSIDWAGAGGSQPIVFARTAAYVTAARALRPVSEGQSQAGAGDAEEPPPPAAQRRRRGKVPGR